MELNRIQYIYNKSKEKVNKSILCQSLLSFISNFYSFLVLLSCIMHIVSIKVRATLG